MQLFRMLKLFVMLFIVNFLFCWIFTSDWGLGPIVRIVSFLGGLLLISLLGIIGLERVSEKNQ
jgi:hypothetical protein